MRELREIPIHSSLTRPLLLAGGERELVLMNAIIIAALILGVGFHWLSFSIAIGLATFGHWGLRALAKRDPQMRRIYVRHISYQGVYSARASLKAPSRRISPSIPVC